ncbi:MAG: AsmA family protein, partial [Alphaproteobacteria bacterium]|nr:AsmA family protein [Alphaproteobacteria bacterium]
MPRKKKKSMFLKVFRIIGLFVGGMAVAVFVALSQVNLETLRGNILGVMRDATGLDIEIDGAMSWVFSLRPKIELNNVRVKNADWAKNKYAFDADRVDVTLNLVSLLRNHPTIQNISVSDVKVALEHDEYGKSSITIANVVDTDASQEKSKSQPKFPFKRQGFAGIEIRNMKANIYGDKYSISGLQVRYMSRQGKREYSGWLKNGMKIFPFIISFSEYNAERKIYPVSIAFTTGGTPLIANVALEGTSLAPIDFVIRGDVPDVAAFGKAIGQSWPELPPMMINVAGGMETKKITLRKSSVAIRGTNMDFSGEYDWSKPVSNIVFNAQAGDVILYKMFPNMYPGTWVHPKRDLNAFKDIPLFGKELSHINLKASVKIKKLGIYRELSINDMDINLKSELGHGRLDIGMVFADGNFKVASDFDA